MDAHVVIRKVNGVTGKVIAGIDSVWTDKDKAEKRVKMMTEWSEAEGLVSYEVVSTPYFDMDGLIQD